MPGENEELIKRLESLERNLAGQHKKSFFDKFGAKFGGDEGIGTAILAQLNRRGIDTSAADEAVQEIIDSLREEAAALLDKLNAVTEAVSDATGKTPSETPDGSGATSVEPSEAPEPESPPPPPMDEAMAPPAPDAGAMDAGGAPPAPDATGGMDAGAGVPPPDPNAVPSDLSVKKVAKKEPDEAAEEAKDGGEGTDDADTEDDDLLDDWDEELVDMQELDPGLILPEPEEDFFDSDDESDYITKILLGGR